MVTIILLVIVVSVLPLLWEIYKRWKHSTGRD